MFSDVFSSIDLDNADFSAGTETLHQDVAAKLRQQIEDFGVWDEGALAQELGFGSHPPADELPNPTDETLTNIMQDMGMYNVFVLSVYDDSTLPQM